MKRQIFFDARDWSRFLFLILFLQSSAYTPHNITQAVSSYIKHQMFNTTEEKKNKIHQTRGVRLLAFTLQPNHFHLIIQELAEGGKAKYMQRVSNAYTKYFNIKYKQTGHLFQNSYRSVHIEDNDQLLYTSAYIHKHAPKISYDWSSLQDYVKQNRWGELLDTSLILEQFENPKEYHQWLKNSSAKEIEENIKHPMFDV